jgi:[ribosomal protein S18]-alanine N-acetyltransferase
MENEKYEVSSLFNEDIFRQIVEIWQRTGVGNAARGDSFEVVNRTLEHGGKILTLKENDTIIGTVWLTHDNRRLYIHHMALHPDWQGKRLSHYLLEDSLQYAHELGYQAKLEVDRDNLPAKHLYEKYGFKALGDFLVLIKREV